MENNLYLTIYNAIYTDDESPARISRGLTEQWEASNNDQKCAIDELLVTLTGWSYKTLVEKSHEPLPED